MEPAAITPETFSFLALFARADWVVNPELPLRPRPALPT